MKCLTEKTSKADNPAASEAGTTPLEFLLSATAVILATLVLAYAGLELRRTNRASNTVLTVISVDAALAKAIGDVRNYQDESTKLALRTGRVPQALTFQIALQPILQVIRQETLHAALQTSNTAPGFSIRPGEAISFDRDLNICSAYPIGDCGYKVKLSLEQHPPAISYEVRSAFPEAALGLERRDRNKVIIPTAAYRDPSRVTCDPRKDIGLTGVLSSDRYDCLSRPQSMCTRGSLPKGLIVNAQTHSLEFECGPSSRVARCPASYALMKMDTRTLDAGEAKAGSCVRTTATFASPASQPAPSLRLAGKVCPAGYKSDSTCSLVDVRSQPGRCGKGVAQPVAGKLHFTQNLQPGEVDCGVELERQTCGAIWEGRAQLKVRCVLDAPEFTNAI